MASTSATSVCLALEPSAAEQRSNKGQEPHKKLVEKVCVDPATLHIQSVETLRLPEAEIAELNNTFDHKVRTPVSSLMHRDYDSILTPFLQVALARAAAHAISEPPGKSGKSEIVLGPPPAPNCRQCHTGPISGHRTKQDKK